MADLSLPPRLGSSSPRGTSTRDWEELSSALLEDGFILTALELYTELLEAGKDVASLRDYFSNPGNFENALPQFPTTGLLHSMGELSNNLEPKTSYLSWLVTRLLHVYARPYLLQLFGGFFNVSKRCCASLQHTNK